MRQHRSRERVGGERGAVVISDEPAAFGGAGRGENTSGGGGDEAVGGEGKQKRHDW